MRHRERQREPRRGNVRENIVVQTDRTQGKGGLHGQEEGVYFCTHCMCLGNTQGHWGLSVNGTQHLLVIK